MRQCKAQAAGNGAPLARTATPQWRIGAAPFGRDDKPSSALLCFLELATASTAVARLTANGFSTRCIHQYHLEGVLGNGSYCCIFPLRQSAGNDRFWPVLRVASPDNRG
jgi:hypothetical protein